MYGNKSHSTCTTKWTTIELTIELLQEPLFFGKLKRVRTLTCSLLYEQEGGQEKREVPFKKREPTILLTEKQILAHPTDDVLNVATQRSALEGSGRINHRVYEGDSDMEMPVSLSTRECCSSAAAAAEGIAASSRPQKPEGEGIFTI